MDELRTLSPHGIDIKLRDACCRSIRPSPDIAIDSGRAAPDRSATPFADLTSPRPLLEEAKPEKWKKMKEWS